MAPTTPAGNQSPGCPVCRACEAHPFMTAGGKDYWRCNKCLATFLDPAWRLPPDAELAHYLNHENHPDDSRYRAFLSKLARPLLERLPARASGLDYGCGPGPALAAMLREAGCEMAVYDPFFAPDQAPLLRSHDFVTCTETAEHFHNPAAEFDRLADLVRPGGILAVMTCFQTDDARFADWHYRKDPTHVVFYREATFRHLARIWGWDCDIPCKDVALLTRPRCEGNPP